MTAAPLDLTARVVKEASCADCGGMDFEWMRYCSKHGASYCRGCECPHCAAEFAATRSDQIYCSARCRQAHYHATKGDGALRGRVASVRRLRHGGVSVIVRFAPGDADKAVQFCPGRVVEVVA